MSNYRKLHSMMKEYGFSRTLINIGSHIKNNFIKIYLESYYVFEKNIDKHIEIEKPKINLDVVLLNKENYNNKIESLISFWPDFFRFNRNDSKLKKDIDYYFKCGDECFLATYNEEIIAMLWLGYQRNYMLKTVGKKIGLKEDEAILHRGYVNDKFRRNNIYPFLGTYIFNHLNINNKKKVYGYVGTSNINSVIANMKIHDRCRFLYHVQMNIFEFNVNIFPEFTNNYLWERK